jgi:phosphoglycolate phosphatase
MLERGLAAADRTLPAAAIDDLTREFVDHYAAHIADHSLPFPGAEAALDELAGLGFQLAVCTNKLEWLSLRLLDALGLSSRFAAICGADTFGIAKPDPEILRRTIGRVGASTDTSIMIGDSLTDIATARAAQVPVIAVDFGYSDTPVKQLSPDHVISHFGELPDAIRALLGSRLPQT